MEALNNRCFGGKTSKNFIGPGNFQGKLYPNNFKMTAVN